MRAMGMAEVLDAKTACGGKCSCGIWNNCWFLVLACWNDEAILTRGFGCHSQKYTEFVRSDFIFPSVGIGIGVDARMAPHPSHLSKLNEARKARTSICWMTLCLRPRSSKTAYYCGMGIELIYIFD